MIAFLIQFFADFVKINIYSAVKFVLRAESTLLFLFNGSLLNLLRDLCGEAKNQ